MSAGFDDFDDDPPPGADEDEVWSEPPLESASLEDGKVKFRCGSCGKALRAPTEKIGSAADCPKCGTPIVVPDPAGDRFRPAAAAPAAEAPAEEWDDEEEYAAAGAGPADVVCPMCGAANDPARTTCETCGERLPEVAGAAPARRRDGGGGRRRRGTVDLGEVFSEGWRVMTENYGLLLGAGIVYMLCTIVVSCVVVGPFAFGGGIAVAAAAGPGAGRAPSRRRGRCSSRTCSSRSGRCWPRPSPPTSPRGWPGCG